MRPTCMLAIAGTLSGCQFNWSAEVETGCPELRTWYRDQDGDQWGTAAESIEACEPENEFTARNDRDCDDDNEAITGRTGSICPPQLVLDTSGATPPAPADVTGVRIGSSEVVVVHAGTERVWAKAAEDACGEIGWGGRLASLSDDTSITQLLSALPAGTDEWAGFVGAEFNTASGQWRWSTGETIAEGRLCSRNEDNTANAADYDPAIEFLALIKQQGGADWCLGTPDEAYDAGCSGADCYTERFAHFACEREPPNPDLYAL